MYCPNCGCQIDDNGNFCPNCGASVQSNQTNTQNDTYAQGNYTYGDQSQQYYDPQYDQYNHVGDTNVDKPEVLLCILSFLLPIVGIILFFVYDDKTPKKAKACLKWALISVISVIVISLIFGAIYFTRFVRFIL